MRKYVASELERSLSAIDEGRDWLWLQRSLSAKRSLSLLLPLGTRNAKITVSAAPLPRKRRYERCRSGSCNRNVLTPFYHYSAPGNVAKITDTYSPVMLLLRNHSVAWSWTVSSSISTFFAYLHLYIGTLDIVYTVPFLLVNNLQYKYSSFSNPCESSNLNIFLCTIYCL